MHFQEMFSRLKLMLHLLKLLALLGAIDVEGKNSQLKHNLLICQLQNDNIFSELIWSSKIGFFFKFKFPSGKTDHSVVTGNLATDDRDYESDRDVAETNVVERQEDYGGDYGDYGPLDASRAGT